MQVLTPLRRTARFVFGGLVGLLMLVGVRIAIHTTSSSPTAAALASQAYPASQTTQTPTPRPASLLDNFNRPGPALGSNWSSANSTIKNNQLEGGQNDLFYWQSTFGADQWASVKILQVSGCHRVDLLLKATNNTNADGLVDVSYNGCAAPRLIIYSFNPKLGLHSPFNSIDIKLKSGDVLKTRVQPNRTVTVYVNDSQVLSDVLRPENAGFDVNRVGQIGLGTSSSEVILDDFAGGNADGTPATPIASTPAPARTPTPTRTPTAVPPTASPTRLVSLPLVSMP